MENEDTTKFQFLAERTAGLPTCRSNIAHLSQRKRTGGGQHVTVKHIHQHVNVTEGAYQQAFHVRRESQQLRGGGSYPMCQGSNTP